ncbi:MAG: histidine phosphatase family protein [Candidatus Saccharicenans sp.]|nr:histidine phosphatase family protein [Candidatus Aminicenantes bacterium]
MTRILLVRHGETEWNRIERFRGSADVPLNDNGLKQAELLARRIAIQWKLKAIYTSPLSRAVKTGEVIGRFLQLPVQIHSGLTDVNYGEWQGLTPDEVKNLWPELYERWQSCPENIIFPKGESLDQRQEIGVAAVKEIAARHPEETVVCVGHTVINRLIILGLLNLGKDYFWRIKQDNGSLNVIEKKGDLYICSALNETGHLLLRGY